MGKAIKKILIPFDGSRNSVKALQQAIMIAKSTGSILTGLHVLNTPMSKQASNVMKKWRNTARQNAIEILSKARDLAEHEGVVFDEKILTGNASDAINNFAKNNKFDMIVMGARGISKIQTIFLGSTSNQIVHKSKIPVVIVR